MIQDHPIAAKPPGRRRGETGSCTMGLKWEERAMITQVEATLTNGVLKPDKPLPFADQTRVRLTVEPIAQSGQSVSPQTGSASPSNDSEPMTPDEDVVRAAVADFEAGRYRTL